MLGLGQILMNENNRVLNFLFDPHFHPGIIHLPQNLPFVTEKVFENVGQ